MISIDLPGATRHRWLLLAFAVLGACSPPDGDAGSDGRLRAVATIGMITDVVAEVGGSRIHVEGLMGPGVDPHLFKASAGDVRRLAGADVIFYNGLHLEAAMAEVLEEMSDRKPTFAVTDRIDRDLLHTSASFQGNYDPHVWFDVGMWVSAVDEVEAALIGLDPAGEAEYRANAATLRDTLQALDHWVERRVAEVPPEFRVLITAHDAFEYFGKRYGFEVIGLQGISTASEAGTGDVQRMVEAIIEKQIPAIFVETSVPRRTIEAVQAAVRSRGFEVEIGGSLFSDAMGNPGTPEGRYPGMVRHNVNMIVEALKPSSDGVEE